MLLTRWRSLGVGFLISIVASVSLPHSVNANVVTVSNARKVDEIVVRYEPGAPTTTKRGRPWGSQCVSRTHRDSLGLGRQLGARMRVLQLHPPVSPPVAMAIADQIAQCRFVDWAEADVIELTIP